MKNSIQKMNLNTTLRLAVMVLTVLSGIGNLRMNRQDENKITGEKKMKRKMTMILMMLGVSVGLVLAGVQSAAAQAGESIVFASDRDGNFEIYVMNSDGSNPINLTNNAVLDVEPTFSPDGSRIAFTSTRDGNFEIYVMNADGSNQTRLTNNPASDAEPTFSPDGSRVAFRSQRDGNDEIYVMNSDGSNQTRLTNNPASDFEPTFSPDSRRVAFTSLRDGNGEIYVMNSDGSNQTRLTNNSASDFEPTFSPDGSRIAFTSERDSGNFGISVMNSDGSNPTRLTNNSAFDGFPSFSPDGSRIAFTSERDGNLDIYVMNADGSQPTNLTNNPASDFQPSFGVAADTDGDGVPDFRDNCPTTPNPERIAFSSHRDGNDEIYVMNADGSNQIRLTNNSAFDDFPTFSPDGSRIAFRSNRSGNFEIYVMNSDGTNQINLTNNSSNDFDPTFSPDGSRIAFISDRDGNFEIYVMNADGTNQINLTNNSAFDFDPTFSFDGSHIAFVSNRDGNFEIYVMNSDGTNQINLTNNSSNDIYPTFSPDGSRIAFTSFRDGNAEVYVMNADGSNQTKLTNNSASDAEPTFSPDGSRIAFSSDRDGNDEIYVMNADGSQPTNLTNNSALDFQPSFGAQADSDGDGIGDACENTAPIANDQLVTTDEDTSVNITLSASDIDNDALTFTITTPPTNGILSGTAQNLVYTPNPDFNGTDAFQFKANDGNLDSNTASVSITVNAVPDNQTITFAPIGNRTFGDAPFNLNATASSGLPVSFQIIAGNATLNGSTLTITGAGQVTVRALQSGNGNYNPAPNVDQIFTVAKAQPMLTVSAPSVITNGGNATLSATLKGVGGVPLANRPIVFSIGNGATAQICTAATNSNGTASCTINNVAQPAGTSVPVSASFASDANYSSATATTTANASGTAIVTRHRPTLNNGSIVGGLRVLTGESFNINSGTTISALYLPGTPNLQRNNGTFGNIVSDGGATSPSNYQVTLNGGTITTTHRQSNLIAFPANIPTSVPAANGTRNVTINKASDVNTIGDWTTVRTLTVNTGNVTIAVPAGNYYSFTINGSGSTLRFAAGTYNFANTIVLNSNSSVETNGQTTVNIGSSLTLNGGKFTLGANTTATNVILNVLSGGVTLNSNSEINGEVRVPNGVVTLNSGNAIVRGNIWADGFTLNGNAQVVCTFCN